MLNESAKAIAALAMEGIVHLQRAFGHEFSISLFPLDTPDGRILKVIIYIPSTYPRNPENALADFEESWWLANCHRSSGRLIFDYERIP